MKERFWSTAELLLRKFNVGKEPPEAHNFTRSEQLLAKWYAWASEQTWLPAGVRLVSFLHTARVAAMTWSQASPLAELARTMMKWADAQPVRVATDAEVRKGLDVLGITSERYGMRPATLADFGKERARGPYFVQAYSEPVHLPPNTRWERFQASVINLIIRWMCRK